MSVLSNESLANHDALLSSGAGISKDPKRYSAGFTCESTTCPSTAAGAASVASDFDFGGMDGMDIDESHDNLWMDRESIAHRFPKASGIVLWDLIMKHYFEEERIFQLFDDSLTDLSGLPIPLLSRSPLNDRDEHTTRERYKNGIKEKGYNGKARSICVLIPYKGANHAQARHVLAAAHCTEALTDCYHDDLKSVKAGSQPNIQVRASVKRGIVALQLKEATPIDVQRHVVTALNEHNTGSGFNLQQVIGLRQRLGKAWAAYKEQHKISVSKAGGYGPYEQLHRNWLQGITGGTKGDREGDPLAIIVIV